MGEVEIEDWKKERETIKNVETKFEKVATKAFMAIRMHAHVLINLLILMLVSGMEELSMKSIKFMKKAFFLEFSDAEAVTFFKGKIQQARKTVVFRKFDNFFHLYAGNKKKKGQQ
jgi:phosphatidylinositol-4,5-bisphosphate 3-kinase